MKKVISSILCLSLLLCGCSKVKEAATKTAEQVYKAAINYFEKNVKYYELELAVDYDIYDMDVVVASDTVNDQYLFETDATISSFHCLHGYAFVDENDSSFMYATPLTKYKAGSIDNEVLEKIVGLFKNNDSMDVYSIDSITVNSVEFDDNQNLVFHLSYEGYDYDYVLTMNIKNDLFKSGTLEIYNGEDVIATINYTFSNINDNIDLNEKWEEVLELEGTSMN